MTFKLPPLANEFFLLRGVDYQSHMWLIFDEYIF